MSVIRSGECRRTETPNAVMTTLASPTQGGAASAVWRTEMAPGACGPEHVFDTEQVWTVLAGSATVEVAGSTATVGAGDTVVIPADVPRRICAGPADGLTAIVTAAAGARVYLVGGDAEADGATRDGDRLLPDWIA